VLPPEAQESPQIRNLLAHLDFIVTAADAPPRDALEAALEADGEDPDLRYRLAASALIGDDVQTALELLLALARSHPGYRNGIARKGMRALLDRLDQADEQVKHYRRELYRLDY
jgi:putative thioredoxin